MAEPIFLASDRSMAVPPGHVVVTEYVPIHRIKMGCRERMAVGDVKGAFEKRLQLGDHQPWPCPRGHWDADGFFVVVDGRHEFIATLMLGHEFLLVASTMPAGGAHAST